jgi:hypothetical protein
VEVLCLTIYVVVVVLMMMIDCNNNSSRTYGAILGPKLWILPGDPD